MSKKNTQRLGDLLLDANLVDEIQLRVALQEQEKTGERLGSALAHLGFIDEAVLAAFLSKQADLPCVNIHGLHIPPDILKLIPKEMALTHSIIPIRRTDDMLYLAMSDPFNETAMKEAAMITGLQIAPLIAPQFRLLKSIERCYTNDYHEEPEPERVSVELSTLVQEMESDSIELLHQKVDQLTEKLDGLVMVVEQLKNIIISKSH